MKRNFLLLTIITAALSSCSTSYRTGQTPDDVYYSPARLQTDEVRRDREENTTTDNTVYTSSEDREIRRRIHNRRYRRYDDRYDYPYGYNSPVYVNPKYGTNGTTQNTSEPRKTNLGAYKPNSTIPDSATYNPKFGKTNTSGTTTSPVRTFGTPNNSSNNGSAVGNLLRKVFTTDNSSNNNTSGNSNNSAPNRTFDRSSNNNSSNSNTRSTSTETKSSSSSSTSAPVRTFGKKN